MSTVNYNQISNTYDEVRQADIELIQAFQQELTFEVTTKVLDIGCGTGNHTDLLQRATHSQLYGLEPSAGMLAKAIPKNNAIVFKQGDTNSIPFDANTFDFVYMTDVIHHIPDLSRMFVEINRVLKARAKLCIVTQSHPQIERRAIAQFFPETVAVDQARYPTLERIRAVAATQNFGFVKNSAVAVDQAISLGPEFLELVIKKGYSMLHLISDEAYHQGVEILENSLKSGRILSKSAGMTLVWLMKKE